MIYLFIFLSSFILSLFLTPFLISYLNNLNIVDKPNERKIHETVIPRMGGIIIYFTTIIFITGFYKDLNEIRIFVLSSIVIASVGIFDDTVGVGWSKKFLLQFFAAGGLVFFFSSRFATVSFMGINFPEPFGHILLFIFIIGVINSVNLLDGMDGLVSGFSLMVTVALFFIALTSGNVLLLILLSSLIGCILGFLKYNAFPARIFLGDTGSLILGFFMIFSSLLVTLDYSPNNLDLTFSLILFGVPIIDTLKVMTIRVFLGKSPFLPDQRHVHHIIMGKRIRHKITVFIIQIYGFLFILSSIYYIHIEHSYSIFLFFFLTASFISIKYMLREYFSNNFVERIRKYITELHFMSIRFYRNYLIPFSALILVILFISIFPKETQVDNALLLASLSVELLFIITLIYRSVRNKTRNELYVLINVLIFVMFSNISSKHLATLFFTDQFLSKIIGISTLLLLTIIISYMLFRDKFFPNNFSLLSGMDLIFMALLTMTTIIQKILGPGDMNFVVTNLTIGFLFYIWYKIFVNFYKNISVYLYYASFILPLFAIIVMYFN